MIVSRLYYSFPWTNFFSYFSTKLICKKFKQSWNLEVLTPNTCNWSRKSAGILHEAFVTISLKKPEVPSSLYAHLVFSFGFRWVFFWPRYKMIVSRLYYSFPWANFFSYFSTKLICKKFKQSWNLEVLTPNTWNKTQSCKRNAVINWWNLKLITDQGNLQEYYMKPLSQSA
jgi:hypothetical protein